MLSPRPLFKVARLAAAAAALLMASAAVVAAPARARALPAPGTPQKTSAAVENSRLDAPLFYQLLVGELELGAGAAGTAYEVMLDAARKSRDEQLYKRATEIALQARAGDQAVAAAKAWLGAHPQSVQAHRYLVQILIVLNRLGEVAEPLHALVALTPANQRNALIDSLPLYFTRSADRAAAAAVLEQALRTELQAAPTRVSALVATGRAWWGAGKAERALELAQRAQADNPRASEPSLLALELLPTLPAAQTIVTEHLQVQPGDDEIRLLYARVLGASQRYAEATAQLEILTQRAPQTAPPWLTLGALYLELRQPAQATVALQKFVELEQKNVLDPSVAEEPREDADDAGAPVESTRNRGLVTAWLMLAQTAEQQNQFASAEAWLAKVDSPQRALEVQSRRASLLARQGRLPAARALIRQTPEQRPEDARAKLMAEVQLLRDNRAWEDAFKLLAEANQTYIDDVDLLYEQSMMAEKLNRLDDMEHLLRRVIVLQPNHAHAHNALGFSLAERNVRLPEARALVQKALELAPNEPFITDSLGWVEYRMGRRNEALKLLRNAYQSRPDPEIAAHLGEVLWVDGNRDEARRIWRDARQRDNANDVLTETLTRLQVEL